MYNLIRSSLCVAIIAGLSASGAYAAQVLGPDSDEDDLVPTGKGWGQRAYPTPHHNEHANPNAGAGKVTANGINYHGGPVLLGTANAYYIWYGNWANNTAKAILEDLAAHIGGSPYYNINTTYYDGSNRHVSNAVTFVKSTTDNYSKGTALTDANIQSIVASAINSGALPKDNNAVYFVLTSADVNETSGFCTQYCGWHTHASITGLGDIKYSFVGNPDRCPSACTAQATGPNGNAGADGMLRFPGTQIENELVALFAKKYAAMHVDAVVTFGTPLRQRSSGQGAGSERTGNSRLSQTHQGRLGAGGQFGESALLRKRKAIAYYNPGGASIGLQAGAQQYGRGGGGGASGARAGGGGGAHADAGGGVAVTPVRTSRSTTAGLTCVPTMSRSTASTTSTSTATSMSVPGISRRDRSSW